MFSYLFNVWRKSNFFFLIPVVYTQYVWHHLNYIWPHFHSLCYHTTLWHHTFCIHIITPRIPVIASTVAGPLLIVYWLYHTYYMCDIKPPICGFYMNSIYSTGILCDITLTLYDKAILYSWHHIHSIHDSTPIPVLYRSFPLAIYFTHGRVYVSVIISQFIPPSPSPVMSTNVIYSRMPFPCFSQNELILSFGLTEQLSSKIS